MYLIDSLVGNWFEYSKNYKGLSCDEVCEECLVFTNSKLAITDNSTVIREGFLGTMMFDVRDNGSDNFRFLKNTFVFLLFFGVNNSLKYALHVRFPM